MTKTMYYIEDQRVNDTFVTVLFLGESQPSRREAIIEAIRCYEGMCEADRQRSESFALCYGPITEDGELMDEDGFILEPLDVIVDLAGSTDEERELYPNIRAIMPLMDQDLADLAVEITQRRHWPSYIEELRFIGLYCDLHVDKYGVQFCRSENGIWSY